jgi:site-specific DNA recombinase
LSDPVEQLLGATLQIKPGVLLRHTAGESGDALDEVEHGLGRTAFARDHIRAVAQRVEVISKAEVRIRGQRSELLRTLTAASGVEAAVLGVRGFEPKWCAVHDKHNEYVLPFLLR